MGARAAAAGAGAGESVEDALGLLGDSFCGEQLAAMDARSVAMAMQGWRVVMAMGLARVSIR